MEMRYIINTNIETAQQEVDLINKSTKHLWVDKITEKLIDLEINYDNTLYLYLVVPGYEQYYPKEILDKAVREMPEDWFRNEEIE